MIACLFLIFLIGRHIFILSWLYNVISKGIAHIYSKKYIYIKKEEKRIVQGWVLIFKILSAEFNLLYISGRVILPRPLTLHYTSRSKFCTRTIGWEDLRGEEKMWSMISIRMYSHRVLPKVPFWTWTELRIVLSELGINIEGYWEFGIGKYRVMGKGYFIEPGAWYSEWERC